MTPENDTQTEELLRLAALGDQDARGQLLNKHRERLLRMAELRMDRRLLARCSPSDVVNETMLEALGNLSHYLEDRPLPFYPWLRQLAWERMVTLWRAHVKAGMRTVILEVPLGFADQLPVSGSGPGSHIEWADEQQARQLLIQMVLERMKAPYREVLVLRYLEEMSFREIAAVLCITEAAARQRHLRALEQCGSLLDRVRGEPTP